MVLRYCGSAEVEVGSRADEAEDFCLTRLSGCDSGAEGGIMECLEAENGEKVFKLVLFKVFKS